MSRIKGGRPRELTNLQIRRRRHDEAMKGLTGDRQRAFKRPGSSNAHKQA
jgi:hypothetical protein